MKENGLMKDGLNQKGGFIMLIGRYLLCTLFLSALLLGLVSMGCGDSNIFDSMADDSTSEAKLEEAQIALDKGDYTTAVNVLLDLCGLSAEDPTSGTPTCDTSTISLLASAYMGRSGLDLINIIKTAEDTSNQGQTGTQDTFSEFSSILQTLNEQDMQNAVELLSDIPPEVRTEEQNLQMAVAAAADTVLIIMNIPGLELDPTTGIPTTLPDDTDIADAANEITNNNNISLILDGVAGSGLADEDLTNDIKTIQTEIAGLDTTVDPSELQSYLCSFDPKPAGCPQ